MLLHCLEDKTQFGGKRLLGGSIDFSLWPPEYAQDGDAQTKVYATSPLISDNQPGAAFTPVYAELRRQPQLHTSRTVERIDIPPVLIIPKVVLYKYLHSDLSFGHARIIEDVG